MLEKWHVFVTEVKDKALQPWAKEEICIMPEDASQLPLRTPSSTRGFLKPEAGPRVWKLENILTPEWEATTPEINPQMLTHLQGKQRWGRNSHQPQRRGENPT